MFNLSAFYEILHTCCANYWDGLLPLLQGIKNMAGRRFESFWLPSTRRLAGPNRLTLRRQCQREVKRLGPEKKIVDGN